MAILYYTVCGQATGSMRLYAEDVGFEVPIIGEGNWRTKWLETPRKRMQSFWKL